MVKTGPSQRNNMEQVVVTEVKQIKSHSLLPSTPPHPPSPRN